MTISYVLSFNPKWYFADLSGRPLGAGYIAFFNNINRTQQLLVYQDPAGNFPWPTSTVPNVGVQGVLIDENGTQGPFYFIEDSSDPTETYYIEVYDSNGNLQWTEEDFTPPGGGGGSVTEAIEVNNLIVNNAFYRNVGSVSSVPVFQKLAPSVHTGLAATTSNAGPDAIFVKNNTSATDAITFPTFASDGNTLSGDVTPYNFMRYACTGSGTSETSKFVQFPINAQVQNLSNEEVVGSIWARCNSGNNQIQVQIRQFYGDGTGAHADVDSIPTTLTLSNTWQKFTFSGTTGNVTGNGIGACGNDGTFLQINLPLNATTSIDIVKPTLYLGTILPDVDFETYDDISSKVDCPRTGDIRISVNAHYPFGWVPLNDGTIGSASSNATSRANLDTFPLFNEIWNMMSTHQPYAPMYDSSGAAVSYGVSAIADFGANRQLSLTKALGNVLAGTSPLLPSTTFTVNTGVSATNLIVSAGQSANFGTGTPVLVSNSGGGLPSPLQASTIYYAIYVDSTHIQLATTLNNALTGTPITLSTNGTGTQTVQVYSSALGIFEGERVHTLTRPELPDPLTTTTPNFDAFQGSSSTHGYLNSGAGNYGSGTITNNGGNQPHNTVQPTVYMNMFIKL